MSKKAEAAKKEQEMAPEETEDTKPAAEEIETEAIAGKPEEASAPEAAKEETHRLSRPPVIDINALLQPIAPDAPSGQYMRYEGVYDEIAEARRADDILAQGAWKEELKVADYNTVISLSVPLLEKETKDLQIAAWLTEALVAEHGFAGLRDGLKLVTSLINTFWESIYPAADDGDEEGRANALAWIDREAAFHVRRAPITEDGWGYNGFLDSSKFDIPDNLEGLSSDQQLKYSALRDQAERENRATATMWRKAVTNTKRAFCEEVDVALKECKAEYAKLNQIIEEKFDRNQAPSLPEIRNALSEIEDQAGKLLEQKRMEEPDPSDISDKDEASAGGAGAVTGTSGVIQSRSDALRRLSEIAAFFKKTEPHSPVSYLVNRAVSWGTMPLEAWLQDVIKDQNILTQLRQTLGFNTETKTEATNAPGSAAENPGTETEKPPGPTSSLQ